VCVLAAIKCELLWFLGWAKTSRVNAFWMQVVARGALAVEAARLGAQVVAIDLSPTLVDLARERIPADVAHLVEFHSGDMLDKRLGHFDHVVAMDSIIHYDTEDAVNALAQLAERTSQSIVFTFAPRTPLLALMISVGRLLPRGDRAPWLEPMAEMRIAQLMKTHTQH
jgi:magnesium-protoporphyrin O-methyltransferase